MTRPLGLPAAGWLGLGVVLTPLAAYRYGVPALAWVAPVPWLVFAAVAPGWRGRLGLFAALVVASTLQVAKIVTPPIPYVLAPLFGFPAAIAAFVVAVAWAWVRRRAGPVAAVAAFTGLSALSDVLTYRTSDLGTWGTTVSTQVDQLAVLQWTAWLGPGLVGLVFAAVAAVLAGLALGDRLERGAIGLGAVVLALLLGASARLEGVAPGAPVRVGLVTTDVALDGAALPAPAARSAAVDRLFSATEAAAARGAQLVVWNEAAAFLAPDEEGAFAARAADVARRLAIDLVVGYGVDIGGTYRNEAAWFGPDGARLATYAKHHPVPGEPSVKGADPLSLVVRPWGRVGVAICYDYDFPALAATYARLGADLVVVPSSDWAGIDPQHAGMARVRAVETGVPIVRPVRAATSAAFDAYGRVRGWATPGPDVTVVDLPVGRVDTLYTEVGDAPVTLLAGLLAAAGLVGAGVRPRRTSPTHEPSRRESATRR